jgi:hypothetical protein
MAEILRSMASRLREYVGNRRRTPRYAVRLDVEISLLEKVRTKNIPVGKTVVRGYTRDVSSRGLGLVVHTIRVDEHYLTGESRILRITLKCPTGSVTLDYRPARYEKLDENGGEDGYLIGGGIADVAEESRGRWQDYLSSLR